MSLSKPLLKHLTDPKHLNGTLSITDKAYIQMSSAHNYNQKTSCDLKVEMYCSKRLIHKTAVSINCLGRCPSCSPQLEIGSHHGRKLYITSTTSCPMEQRRGAIAQPPPVSYHCLCGITEEHHKQCFSAAVESLYRNTDQRNPLLSLFYSSSTLILCKCVCEFSR